MRKIIKNIRQIRRNRINKENIKKLKNNNMSIFSSNCIVGVLYHELGLRFMSPFINIYVEPKDYIKFLKNPKIYLKYELKKMESNEYSFPVAQLNDVKLYGVHYKNFDEMNIKWKERIKRINWDNLYVFMVERDGCSEEDIKEFDKLPYKNKVIFVHKEMPDVSSAVYIEKFKYNDPQKYHRVKDLTQFSNCFSAKRLIDRFDYVSFFNTK